MIRYVNLFRNLSNWWLYLAVKFRLVKADVLLFKTRKGIFVEVPGRLLHTFKEIFMEECYMAGLDGNVPENPTIIDIGANAGYFTLFAASRFNGARIWAYEPIPSNFKQLERNCRMNENIHVTCLQKAVSGHSGKIVMRYDSLDSFTTSATVLSNSDDANDVINVDSVTISEIFEEYGINKCDLLKMDCEGAEYDIIYKCPPDDLQKIEQIAMEVHKGPGPAQDMESLEKYLMSHGFSVRRYSTDMMWAWRR